MQFLERFTFGSHEIEYELVGETVTSLKLIQRHERDLCSLDEEIPEYVTDIFLYNIQKCLFTVLIDDYHIDIKRVTEYFPKIITIYDILIFFK